MNYLDFIKTGLKFLPLSAVFFFGALASYFYFEVKIYQSKNESLVKENASCKAYVDTWRARSEAYQKKLIKIEKESKTEEEKSKKEINKIMQLEMSEDCEKAIREGVALS